MASVIVLFIFLISSLNDLKRGGWLATQSTPHGSAPAIEIILVKSYSVIMCEPVHVKQKILHSGDAFN